MTVKSLKILCTVWGHSKARCYIALGVIIAVSVSTVQPLLIGTIYSDAEAIKLIEGLQNSSLYLGSSMAGVSATVLALMLTLLSMTNKADISFDRSVYHRIEAIGLISTLNFIGAVILLLCLSLPIGEFENIPSHWFTGLYYLLTTLNGFLVGSMVVGILVLFDTIRTLIKQLSPK